MISNKKILVTGGGGFIGGHLTKELFSNKNRLRVVDIKPLEFWFQIFDENENISLDLRNYDDCLKITKDIDYVFNMACNMGGMGFIENNKAECMLSVLINTNLLRACLQNKVQKYFFSSSACVYNAAKQKNTFIKGLKEEDAYPAEPEDGYGWEKLFSERMCRHFYEDFGLETRIARYHNIYGPLGTFDGGREKAPAAIARKIIQSKLNNSDTIDIWGDGEQTRTFLYINDCVKGTLKLFESDFREPLNIGSDEQVSINQMADIIQSFDNLKLKKNYQLNKPKGVRGRSSDNTLCKKVLNWSYEFTLTQGLRETYNWIYKQLTTEKSNNKKFTRSLID
jgi:nucleoside-diphosphate-sugar epimerase